MKPLVWMKLCSTAAPPPSNTAVAQLQRLHDFTARYQRNEWIVDALRLLHFVSLRPFDLFCCFGEFGIDGATEAAAKLLHEHLSPNPNGHIQAETAVLGTVPLNLHTGWRLPSSCCGKLHMHRCSVMTLSDGTKLENLINCFEYVC